MPPAFFSPAATAPLAPWILLGTVLLALLIFMMICVQSLRRWRKAAEELARHPERHRLPSSRWPLIRGIITPINQLVARLQQRLTDARAERNELESLLTSMSEGVIAVNRDQAILRMNRAAGRMLDIDTDFAIDRRLHEVVRHAGLLEIADRAIETGQPATGEIRLHLDSEEPQIPRFLKLRASPLADAGGHSIGVLLVMHDVSRTRKLERIRRDFVANVSHELKTPITAIKGFTEVLADGVDDPDQTRRFLTILDHQADRLHRLVDDLLTLAELEQSDAPSRQRPPTDQPVRPCLEAAAEACSATARHKEISVNIDVDAELSAPIYAPLIEQAVINLIDNAIKYSPEGSHVTVTARQQSGQLRIDVADDGPGIDAGHLDRLFERFYRVDRHRSREVGGTGLGLSIVKHVAAVHGGRASVTSELDEGSVFTLEIPATVHEPDAD